MISKTFAPVRTVFALTVVVGAALALSASVGAQGNTPAASALAPADTLPSFVPGSARAAPQVTQDQVLAIVRSQFGSNLLTHRPSVSYGAFVDNNYRSPTPVGLQAVGAIDAWEVTVTGISMPRPCAALAGGSATVASACPPIHTFTVVVDDK